MMAAPAERSVDTEFVFDRVADQLLVQAYRILVPERRARTSQSKETTDDSSSISVADCEDPAALA
jgi:hypothetical protein